MPFSPSSQESRNRIEPLFLVRFHSLTYHQANWGPERFSQGLFFWPETNPDTSLGKTPQPLRMAEWLTSGIQLTSRMLRCRLCLRPSFLSISNHQRGSRSGSLVRVIQVDPKPHLGAALINFQGAEMSDPRQVLILLPQRLERTADMNSGVHRRESQLYGPLLDLPRLLVPLDRKDKPISRPLQLRGVQIENCWLAWGHIKSRQLASRFLPHSRCSHLIPPRKAGLPTVACVDKLIE